MNLYFILCYLFTVETIIQDENFFTYLQSPPEHKYRYIMYVFNAVHFIKLVFYRIHRRTAGSTLSSNIHPEQIPGQESPT